MTFANIPMTGDIKRMLDEQKIMYVRARTRSEDHTKGYVEVTMGYEWIPIKVRERMNEMEEGMERRGVEQKMEVIGSKEKRSNRPEIMEMRSARLSMG